MVQRFLFIFLLSVFSASAFAGLRCGYVFNSDEINQTPESFFQKLNTQDRDKITDLAQSLVDANKELFKISNRSTGEPADLSRFKIHYFNVSDPTNRSGYATVDISLKNIDDGSLIHSQIRTNGSAAFFHRTFFQRENPTSAGSAADMNAKRYKSVYFENGEIKTADQGEILISSLPDQLYLSRSMKPGERKAWLNDAPMRSSAYGPKLHFAPNYFIFKNDEPYLLPMSKVKLLEYYRNGDIEINTYDVTKREEFWRGKIDLEFEIVFVGKNVIENLRPWLKESLRQEIFPFEYSPMR